MGTKAGRIARVVRLFRLIRIVKLYKQTLNALETEANKDKLKDAIENDRRMSTLRVNDNDKDNKISKTARALTIVMNMQD